MSTPNGSPDSAPLEVVFAEIAREGDRAALATIVSAPGDEAAVGRKLLVRADGAATGTLGDPELDSAAIEAANELLWEERSELRTVGDVGVFVDVTAPAPRLIAFGATDLADPLCRAAKAAGMRPYVVDPRGAFATKERFPDAIDVISDWPEKAFQKIGAIDRATAICVLTHDPKLDDAALAVALRSEAAYIGALGSRRAQADRRERLLAAGFGEEDLARIAGPAGLDIGAVTNEETAISLVAEIIAVRRNRPGGRLRDARGRIHDIPA
jgi:xanthine dehydrogenase accessory factor